jgi:hypothetical protein
VHTEYGSEEALFDTLPTIPLTFSELIDMLKSQHGFVVTADEIDALQAYLRFPETPMSRTSLVEGLGLA